MKRRYPQGRVLALLAVGVLLIAFGIACTGDDSDGPPQSRALVEAELADRQTKIDALLREQSGLASQVKELREQVERFRAELDGKNNEIVSLQRQVQTLSARARTIDAEALGTLRDQLEADRLLLVELRKDTPETRQEAILMWENIRKVAPRSDPNLISKVDRVARTLPLYYNWLEQDFATSQEAQIAFVLTGANQFNDAVDEFWKAFLLVLIDRIDAVAKLSG